MRIAEFEKQLKQNSFYLKRRNKHPIWTDGLSTIVMPSGGPVLDRRLSKKLALDLEKAIARRPRVEEKKEVQPFNQIDIPRSKPIVMPKETLEKPVPKAQSYERAWEVYQPMRKAGVSGQEAAERMFDLGILKPSGNPYMQFDLSKLAFRFGAPRLRKASTRKKVEAKAVAEVPQQHSEMKVETTTSPLEEIRAVLDSRMSMELQKSIIKSLALKL